MPLPLLSPLTPAPARSRLLAACRPGPSPTLSPALDLDQRAACWRTLLGLVDAPADAVRLAEDGQPLSDDEADAGDDDLFPWPLTLTPDALGRYLVVEAGPAGRRYQVEDDPYTLAHRVHTAFAGDGGFRLLGVIDLLTGLPCAPFEVQALDAMVWTPARRDAEAAAERAGLLTAAERAACWARLVALVDPALDPAATATVPATVPAARGHGHAHTPATVGRYALIERAPGAVVRTTADTRTRLAEDAAYALACEGDAAQRVVDCGVDLLTGQRLARADLEALAARVDRRTLFPECGSCGGLVIGRFGCTTCGTGAGDSDGAAAAETDVEADDEHLRF